ncbi:MAG: hypothetical protein ABIG85_08280 [Chloroflexota bacterium]
MTTRPTKRMPAALGGASALRGAVALRGARALRGAKARPGAKVLWGAKVLREAAVLTGAVALATILLAACAAPPPTTPLPTLPAPTSVPTPIVSPPAFVCGETVRSPGTVPVARITGFAVANDAGVGRITFTFRPSGNVAAIPDVEVRPGVPPFTLDPSGLPLDVEGTSFVVLTLQGGTALDDDFNSTFDGPFDSSPPGGPIVDVRRAGDFEAVSSWVVGLDGPPCVRILPFDGSSRLVIEIEER